MDLWSLPTTEKDAVPFFKKKTFYQKNKSVQTVTMQNFILENKYFGSAMR